MSGSWQIRGEQLSRAAGAVIVPKLDAGVGKYDLAIIVKRPRQDALEHLRKARIPIVWDIVDSHPQPEGNLWDRDRCMRWLRDEIAMIRPQAIVAATKAQAFDCAEFGLPTLALPHHARPWQALNPVRENVRLTAFEGGPQYIVQWRPIIEAECRKRNWKFVLNPPSLADVDIVLALRDQKGYAAVNWKSAVKLANAMGSQTPVVCARSAAHNEQASGAEQWADDAKELIASFDVLTDHATRKRASICLHQATPTLEKIAGTYKAWLNQVLKF